MGRLKPSATYVYEQADGVTYAREFGAAHETRFEIGRTLERLMKEKNQTENKYWNAVLEEAKTNKVLQDAIDRVKLIYELSKKDGTE